MFVDVIVFTLCVVFFFFFSSRRRHTRCSRDWSSDVCSSDLPLTPFTVDRYLIDAQLFPSTHTLSAKVVIRFTPRSDLNALTFELNSALKVDRSEEHTSELQSRLHLVCRLLLEKKNKTQ